MLALNKENEGVVSVLITTNEIVELERLVKVLERINRDGVKKLDILMLTQEKRYNDLQRFLAKLI